MEDRGDGGIRMREGRQGEEGIGEGDLDKKEGRTTERELEEC